MEKIKKLINNREYEFVKIEDQSGDRKYFTQIPNMIVNHSTAYEQSLYLIMKRLAGEKGSCYASINWLSKKMGVAKRTVSQTIEKLLRRRWIKEIESKIVSGGEVRQFTIVDLWKLNLNNYEIEGGTQMTTFGNGVEPLNTEVEPTGSLGGTQKHPKKIY